MNIQGWFPLRLTGLISLQSKGLSRVFSNTTVQKHQFFHAQHSVNCDAIYMKVYGKSYKIYFLKISFQFSSVTQSYPAVCNPMECSIPGLPVHHQLPELAQTHVRWVSDAIQPSHPLSSPSFPAFNLARDQGLFQWVSSSHQVAKVLEFQLQHQTSFRTDWFDLLAVQGTLKSLLQHHSSKASSLVLCFLYGLALTSIHDYWKNHSFDYTYFVRKVMPLLFNTLSRLVIAFIPRSKCLLISWLQSPSAMILEPKKIVCHCFHSFPIYLSWNDGTGCHDLSFLNVEFYASFFTLLFHFH